jgi:hypothetical protein
MVINRAVHPEKLAFFLTERPFFQTAQGLVYFVPVLHPGKHQVYGRIGKGKAVEVGHLWHKEPGRVALGRDGQQVTRPVMGGIKSDNPRVSFLVTA